MFLRPEKGQALVVGLVVLFFGTITLFYLFNTGQVSADKQRLTNAADAAAYSAALWRARVLNYDAYSNRAMIANEVAISQSLTLVSTVQFHKNLAACLAQEDGDNGETCKADIAQILQIVPYFPEIAEIVWEAMTIYDDALQVVLPAELEMRSTGMNQAFSVTQEALNAATIFEAVQEIAQQVAQANDVKFSAQVLPDLFGGPDGFTKRYTDEDRNRIANLVREGMDPYSVDRRFTFKPPLPCGFYELRRRGGTGLDSSLEHWEAIDTLSEWEHEPTLFGCEGTEHYMGYGDRQGSDGESDRVTGNPASNPDAFDNARETAVQPAGYTGIQAFRDLNYESLDDDDELVKDPTHKLGVVVSMDGASLRTSNTLNIGVGRLRMPEKFEKNGLRSIAAAEVFFKRPEARGDGRIEYPSLFNPYWQARLAEPTLAQRAAAAAL
jgi:hypothetical protein